MQFAGESYCPGYLSYVLATAYGTGSRIVISGLVTVAEGSTVMLEGGSPCYPADAYCGQTLLAAPVSFHDDVALPSYGDMINVYGTTTSGAIDAVGYEYLFSCPDWTC